MDVIPSENKPRISGPNQNDIQSPLSSKNVAKRSKKESAGLQEEEKQGDVLDVSAGATVKKEESAVPVGAAGGLQGSGFNHDETLSQTKSFIMEQWAPALNAQAGSGATFIKSLFE